MRRETGLPESVIERRCPDCAERVADGSVHACPRGGPGPRVDPDEPLLHAVLGGRYEIMGRIGRGGMGEVYRARHLALGTDVALKVLVRSADATAQQRFAREAQLASSVRHPNTVVIHDFGVLRGGRAYLVMELIQGQTLAAALSRGPLKVASALRIARQIADGLAAVHAQDIVHRDLKPDNIFLVAHAGQPDFVKIVDFGIALTLAPVPQDAAAADGGGPRLTVAGSTIGTAHYMSPEQAEGAALDGRSDQYALGVVLYEMLSGKLPFEGSPMTILAAHLTRPPPALSARAPGASIPAPVEQLVMRMLAKEPGQRLGSMREVIREIDRLLALLDPARRRRRLSVLGAAVLGAAAVVAITLAQRTVERPSPRELLAARAEALALLRAEATSVGAPLRERALRELGPLPDRELTPLFAEGLRDPRPPVQLQAAESLAEHGDRGARSLLHPLLESPHRELAVTAAESLLRLGDSTAEAPLRRHLSDAAVPLRVRAALALCRVRNPEAARLLRTLAGSEVITPARRPALLGRLAECGDDKARPELAELLGRGGPDEQSAAAAALLVLGDGAARAFVRERARRSATELVRVAPLLPLLDEGVELAPLRGIVTDKAAGLAQRELAAVGLGASRWAGDVPLLRRLVRERPPSPLQLAAARSLVQIVDNDPAALTAQSLDFAERALKDGDWQVRASATAVLADLADPAALDLLGAALERDGDARVRRAAARALGRRRERDALTRLHAARRDVQPEVREEALRSLLHVAEAAGVREDVALLRTVTGWLREVQKQGSAREQVLAAVAQLRLGEAAAAEQLRAVLTGGDVALRRLALEQPLPSPELMALALADADSGVRLAAARHLAELGDPRALPVLREAVGRGGVDALLAYGALRRLDPGAPEPTAVQAALKGQEAGARLQAVEALAMLPPELAVPLLQQAAQDPEPLVRRLAAEVAAELGAARGADAESSGSPPGLPVLRVLVADADAAVQARARALLARLNTPRALAAEARALGQPPVTPGTAPTTSPGNRAATAIGAGQASPPPAAAATSVTAPAAGQPASPAPEDESETEAAAGQGYILLSAAPHQYVQIDDGPWRKLKGRRIPLAAGAHVIRTLQRETQVTVAPGDTTRLRLREAPVERLVRAGVEAVERKDLRKARQLLEKAAARCPRGRGGCDSLQSDVSLNLGRVYEGQREYPSALREYQRLLSHGGHTGSSLRTQAQEGITRLKPLLGRVLLRRNQGGRCVETTLWLPVGEHAVDVGGKSQSVLVQSDAEQRVGQCEP